MNKEEEILTIDLNLETKEVKSKVIKTNWTIVETPYMILSDKNKIWNNEHTRNTIQKLS